MSDGIPSPEQVVAQFSIAELQELLTDLRLASTPTHARRFQNLVAELESFDEAIKIFGLTGTRRLLPGVACQHLLFGGAFMQGDSASKNSSP